MRRYLIISILVVGIFLNLSAINGTIYAPKEFSTRSNIISSIYYLGKELGISIDKNEFLSDLHYYGASPYVSEKLPPKAIIKAARNQGMFLNGFKIKNKKLSTLSNINHPFVIYVKHRGYIVIEKVNLNYGNFIFKCILPNGKRVNINEDEFWNNWNGEIYSFPLVGITAKRLNAGEIGADSKFVAVYSYHTGENFKKLKKFLDRLRVQTKEENKKLIYMDELGLIPSESVEKKMEEKHISRKKAFLKIKDAIEQEDKMIEEGVPIHLPNPFYNNLFSYLARHKVKSIIEDLDYNLWKKIIAFDNLKLHDKATSFFFTADIQEYIDTMREYTKGFWEYNVLKRDKKYRKQIKQIMNKYPKALIFTLRGIGHYGMEENIETDDFSVETYIFAKGKFRENLVSSQYLHVLWTNGVMVEEDKENKMFLKSFPQEALRIYLKNRGIKISKATRIAVNLTESLSMKEILKLSSAIRKRAIWRKFENANDIWKFVYKWMKERRKIPVDISEKITLLR